MKTKLLAMMLLAGGSMFAQTRFSVGIGFNQPAAVYASHIPPCPGPGYVWTNGYWDWNGGSWVWVGGNWAVPPAGHHVWVEPYYHPYHGAYHYHRGHWR